MKKQETTIITTIEVTIVSDKKYPYNKSLKSYAKDMQVVVDKIKEVIDCDDVKIATKEDGTPFVQVFKMEV